jgi:DNA-binding IclR family transcriptional regulator
MLTETGRRGTLHLDARALALGYRHGPDTLLILLDLASRAVDSHEGTTVAASYRDIARRMGISKDTVGRRMQVLRRSGVVVEKSGGCDRFGIRSYLLQLDLVGVTREPVPVAA